MHPEENSPLARAVHAVDAALARLASAIAGTHPTPETSDRLSAELTHAQETNRMLREENLRLSNALHALQQEHLALQTTASSTLTRLDRSVKQLDLMLES